MSVLRKQLQEHLDNMSVVDRISFEDLLAWNQCPLAAKAGYKPIHPRGDLRWTRQLADEWPNNTRALARMCPTVHLGNRWLQSTEFGVQRITTGPSDPPPAQLGKGFWRKDDRLKNWKGTLDIPTPSGQLIKVEFELPYLHKIHDVWEIVLIDGSKVPPNILTRSSLSFEASFLMECFRYLTGQHAYARLIAPGYSHEERLYYPPQSIDNFVLLYHSIKSFGILRPGEHCKQHMPDKTKSVAARKWLCPLRDAKHCTPFPDK